MSLYLDASVMVPTLVGERRSAAVDRYLRTAEPLIISELAAIEVASAIARLARMTLIDGDLVATLLDQFGVWRASSAKAFDLEPADFHLAGAFVRRFDLGLRAPDALHAAACRRGGHVLVTLDRRLATAAATFGVEVAVPDGGADLPL